MIALRFAAINALPLSGRPLASFSKRGLMKTRLAFTGTANLPEADFFELAKALELFVVLNFAPALI